jgi:hypothetical protein
MRCTRQERNKYESFIPFLARKGTEKNSKQIKKNAPCIIFIDEIDAVARRRGTGMGGGHDEREQTLNQMLVEMDGFGVNEGIIVMAATNRVDILDPAIMRPGRFDRKVVVGRPDVRGREEILGVHAKNKPLGDDVDLKQIAQTTAGFTGADLENLLNEAAIIAAKENRAYIKQDDIKKSFAAIIAASFNRFSRSAPVNPAVVCAICFKSTSSPSGLFFACTPRISSLPRTSGRPTTTLRSKRPGRMIAGSKISTRLVAAMTMIPSLTPNPSISTSIWFKVCSRSS